MKNLKYLRNQKGLSQAKLAEILGINQQSINAYENRGTEPDVETLIKISDYFNTSIDFLVGRVDAFKRIDNTKDEELLLAGYRRLSAPLKNCIYEIVVNLQKSQPPTK